VKAWILLHGELHSSGEILGDEDHQQANSSTWHNILHIKKRTLKRLYQFVFDKFSVGYGSDKHKKRTFSDVHVKIIVTRNVTAFK
jgi:hypothetical protein